MLYYTNCTALAIAEADAELRETCKTRASLQRRMPPGCQGDDTQETANDNEKPGVGLLGLGDQDYAVGSELFNHFAYQKHFVQHGAAEWRAQHSECQAFDSIDPQSKPVRQCSSFCVHSALAEHNISQESFDSCKALLFLVNRGMKELYAAIKKQIDSSARHPLLFVRMLQPTGQSEFRGWLLTRAMFKPRQIDGICVYPVNRGHTLSTDGSDEDFEVYMDFQSVGESAEQLEMRMPAFACMDQIAFEIAVLKSLFPDGRFQYCFRPEYSLGWVLTHLRVTGLKWIEPGELQLHDSDDEAPDDSDSQGEIDHLDDLVQDLISLGATGDTVQKTSKPRRAKNDASGRYWARVSI